MFDVCSTSSERPESDLLILPLVEGKEKGELLGAPSDLKNDLEPILSAGDFKGKQGQTLLLYPTGKGDKRLLLLGLGKDQECSMEKLRRAFAAAIKRCQTKPWKRINVVLPTLKQLASIDIERAVCEGIGLTLYVFEEWKSQENKKLFHIETVTLIGTKDKKTAQKVTSLLTGVHLARDLINRNALDITPQALGDVAKKLARTHSTVKGKIYGKKEIEKEKMGLLLAVASGSRCDPALIQLEYHGNPKSDDLTLIVGKGVTFDTGGLNLKPTGHIEDMRTDMSGGAAALGVIQAAAEMKLKANIAVLVPATENAIDAESYKPGDVYRSAKGLTVEITNTDAEGRLALADALTFGQKRFSPTRIVDLATLTGAVVIALGEVRMGLFTNHDAVAEQLYRAGERTGERVWQLPLDDDYKEALESSIADCKNCATKRGPGSVTAAIFLEKFIENKTPWVHLDIAGTARISKPRDYHLTHASGSGVRLLIEWIESLTS